MISDLNKQKVKSLLIQTLGETPVAFIQAVRFVYLLHNHSCKDPEIKLLKRFLKEGDVAVDIGANGADWTYELHKCVGKKGQVYAFEADPYYARATALAVRIMRMEGVKLFSFGLSDSEESAVLCVTDMKGLRVSGLGYIDRNAKGGETVHLRKLDSLIQELPRLLETALIKCDVEGYELFVFKGAEEVLKKARPFIILEVGDYERQGYSACDVFNFFEKREYLSLAMVNDADLAPTGPMLDQDRAIGVNRVLVPREKKEAIDDIILAP
jgi:FkbM family methyltransferase